MRQNIGRRRGGTGVEDACGGEEVGVFRTLPEFDGLCVGDAVMGWRKKEEEGELSIGTMLVVVTCGDW